MIEIRSPALIDFARVAALCPADEIEVYREMTGREFDADDVAAAMWCAGGRRYVFWETVERLPLAVGGYLPDTDEPGTWQSWFMGTPLGWSKQYGAGLTARVADVVQMQFRHPEVERLETVTLATRTRARAWYERIGLTYESTACKASASGLDLVTYVALRK